MLFIDGPILFYVLDAIKKSCIEALDFTIEPIVIGRVAGHALTDQRAGINNSCPQGKNYCFGFHEVGIPTKNIKKRLKKNILQCKDSKFVK